MKKHWKSLGIIPRGTDFSHQCCHYWPRTTRWPSALHNPLYTAQVVLNASVTHQVATMYAPSEPHYKLTRNITPSVIKAYKWLVTMLNTILDTFWSTLDQITWLNNGWCVCAIGPSGRYLEPINKELMLLVII